jgi:predicted transcriptional regulator
VKPEDTLETAIGLLRKYDVSQLPVVADGVQVGSVSEISIMKKLASKEVGYKQNIGDIMGEPLPIVKKTDKILDPLSLLKDKNAVLVLDNNKIVDIITTIDVINYFMKREAAK